VLFARWSARPGAIFRLGAEQGLYCLGCCAGLMAAMVATGVMNPFWMALIADFAAVEKQLASPLPGRIAGAILLVWAALLLVMSV
jgi:predicted metal-binding membrane protein